MLTFYCTLESYRYFFISSYWIWPDRQCFYLGSFIKRFSFNLLSFMSFFYGKIRLPDLNMVEYVVIQGILPLSIVSLRNFFVLKGQSGLTKLIILQIINDPNAISRWLSLVPLIFITTLLGDHQKAILAVMERRNNNRIVIFLDRFLLGYHNGAGNLVMSINVLNARFILGFMIEFAW